MCYDGIVAQPTEMQVVCERNGSVRFDSTREHLADAPSASLKEAEICTGSSQICRHSADRGIRPGLGRQALLVGSRDEFACFGIGEHIASRGVRRPIHIADEVSENRVGSTGIDQEHLLKLARGQSLAESLQVLRWSTAINKQARMETLRDEVA